MQWGGYGGYGYQPWGGFGGSSSNSWANANAGE
jgi:hypothetical protein